MSKRIKPVTVVLSDIKQVEGSLAEMAAIERKLNEVTSNMNSAIDAAKAKAEQDSESLQARYVELAGAIKVYVTLNKAQLFTDRKSLDLAFGVVGFHASTQIVQVPNITKETTLKKLEEFGFTEAINTQKSVLKSAMTNWSDEKLESVGVKRQNKNTFYIEIKTEVLSTA